MDLPTGWTATTLGAVADWASGGTPSRKRPDFFGGDIPWIKTGELTEKYIFDTEEMLTELGVKNSSAKVFPRGSVGIAMYGATIGKVSIWGNSASTNQACAVARPINGVVSSEFLYHLLRSERDALVGEGKGGAQPNISQGILKAWPILLPPPNEQRRIVEKIEALFDEIDKGVESLRAAKSTLDLYHKSLLKSAFEGRLTAHWRTRNPEKLESSEELITRAKHEKSKWHRVALEEWVQAVEDWQSDNSKGPKPRRPEHNSPSVPLTPKELDPLPRIPQEWVFLRLSDIAAVSSGMSVSKSREPEIPIDIPYLRVANVQRGFLDLSEIKTMKIERSQFVSLQLRPWDVLFNEGGDRDKLGRGWVWECQVPQCITQNHVFRASPFRNNLEWSKYISRWGNSFGRDYFEKGGKQTTNLASINKTVLKALPVPYCSVAEQAEIIRILEKCLETTDGLESEIEAAFTRAEALRQSILKNAFSGRLVPQDPNDEPAAALLQRILAKKASHNPDRAKRRVSTA